jgi:hypothetical protein
MNYPDRLTEIPYLKYAFYSYLLLGVTDTLRRYIKHSPKTQRLCVEVSLTNQSAMSAFSDESLG